MAEENVIRQNRNIVIGVILFILIICILYFFFQNQQIKKEKTQREIELNSAILQLDSVSQELVSQIRIIEELGGEVDTLIKIRERLEIEKKSLLNLDKRRKENIEELKERVGGYKQLLLIKDQEIKQLKYLNDQLVVENNELKEETIELNQNLRDVNSKKSELEEKINIAGKLSAEEFKILAVSSKGKERESAFRNRHIDKLKISFYVLENEFAPIEGKELLIRILAPDGNVLFDVSRGSGTFFYEGRELFFTVKKEILYDSRP